MLTASFPQLRKAERDYPGIQAQLRHIETSPKPTTTAGITGRSILLTALTTRFSIVAMKLRQPSPEGTLAENLPSRPTPKP